MGYNFPDTPTDGQVYSGYVWNAAKGAWEVQGAANSGAVRYDTAQGLTAPQQTQGRSNIGAVDAATVTAGDAASVAAIAAQAVRYDAAQTLTATQRSQARANIDVTKKNYIINGAMMVSQENGSTLITAINLVGYPVDQFQVANNNTAGQSAQQIVSLTPGGSPNRIREICTVADTSVAATDYSRILHKIEGSRVADLRFGTASAKTVTLQFGVKAPAGTYCVALSNAAANRTYAAEYVIAAGEANTDVVRSITVPGDTSGTWATGNTTGMMIMWTLMVGSTYQQAAGSWGTVQDAMGTSNQFNLMAGGNTFELFDVSLTEGAVAPPLIMRPYDQELVTCQRYWERTDLVFVNTGSQPSAYWATPKRATPTLSTTINAGTGGAAAVFSTSTTKGFFQSIYHSTVATATVTGDARL
jgi:hypothetical protein